MHEASMYATLLQAPQNYRLRPAPDYSELIFDRIPDGTSEDDFHINAVEQSEVIIMLSQVDQALCDEAETGRIHGQGSFLDNCWVNGGVRINLHTPWYPCSINRLIQWGYLEPATGMPCIEYISQYGSPDYLNNHPDWNTRFPYLRMSTERQFFYVPTIPGGATQSEVGNATVLCKKFELSGCWGGKNRVAENSNWYEDKTVDKCGLACGWFRLVLTDADNIPMHSVLYNINGDHTIILPEMILRRPSFEARRVFMAPSNIHYPIKYGNGASNVINVTLALPKWNFHSDESYLCYTGGANAVDIADLTLFYRVSKINLLIVKKQGISGWKFAMRFAVRLRREHIPFNIKLLSGSKCSTLSLKQLRAQLAKQGLIAPKELNDDFGGSLNTFIERRRTDLIKGVLGKGELMLIAGTHSIDAAFYIATSVKHGCWDKRWKPIKRNCNVALFADKYNLASLEKTTLHAGVDIYSGTLSLPDCKRFAENSNLVILASEDMQSDKPSSQELIKFCLNRGIAIIAFSEKPDVFIDRVAGQKYSFDCRLNETEKEYRLASMQNQFGVSFTLTQQGQLAECRDLTSKEYEQLVTDHDSLPVSNGIENIGKLLAEDTCNAVLGCS